MNRTMTTQEELASLPAGTVVKSANIQFGIKEGEIVYDVWKMRGGYIADCISAGSYSGPVSEIALPATVLATA